MGRIAGVRAVKGFKVRKDSKSLGFDRELNAIFEFS